MNVWILYSWSNKESRLEDAYEKNSFYISTFLVCSEYGLLSAPFSFKIHDSILLFPFFFSVFCACLHRYFCFTIPKHTQTQKHVHTKCIMHILKPWIYSDIVFLFTIFRISCYCIREKKMCCCWRCLFGIPVLCYMLIFSEPNESWKNVQQRSARDRCLIRGFLLWAAVFNQRLFWYTLSYAMLFTVLTQIWKYEPQNFRRRTNTHTHMHVHARTWLWHF